VDFSTPRQQLHRALLVYPTHTLSARNVPQSMSFPTDSCKRTIGTGWKVILRGVKRFRLR
jgi:hypothetical protein